MRCSRQRSDQESEASAHLTTRVQVSGLVIGFYFGFAADCFSTDAISARRRAASAGRFRESYAVARSARAETSQLTVGFSLGARIS